MLWYLMQFAIIWLTIWFYVDKVHIAQSQMVSVVIIAGGLAFVATWLLSKFFDGLRLLLRLIGGR